MGNTVPLIFYKKRKGGGRGLEMKNKINGKLIAIACICCMFFVGVFLSQQDTVHAATKIGIGFSNKTNNDEIVDPPIPPYTDNESSPDQSQQASDLVGKLPQTGDSERYFFIQLLVGIIFICIGVLFFCSRERENDC